MTSASSGVHPPYILRTRVDPTSYAAASALVAQWVKQAESRYVCVANVHLVMEAYDDPSFAALINRADLVTPDGMPLVWVLRRLGYAEQERVYGPELMQRLIAVAAEQGWVVGFYGGEGQTLARLVRLFQARFPALRVGYAYSPPFRTLTEEEDGKIVAEINAAGVQVLFVGLGCPKQERWMAQHHGQVQAVMLGVGAAFDFLSGAKPQAPAWMQRSGLEWLFRLASEPRRLWRRYVYHNPRFMWLAARQLWETRK